MSEGINKKWKKKPEYFYPKHEPMSEELKHKRLLFVRNTKGVSVYPYTSGFVGDKAHDYYIGVAKEYAKAKTEELQKEVEIREREGLELHRQIKGWKQENQNHRKYTDKLKAENEALKNGMIEIKRKYLLSIKLKAEIDELLKPKEG